MNGVARPVAETEDTRPLVFGPHLLRPWVVANFVAFTIGGLVGGGILRGIIGPWFGSDVSALEAARIQATGSGASTAIFWTLAGTAQWLVLRRAIRAAWWMPVTAVGATICGVIGGFSSGGGTSHIGPVEGPVPLSLALLALPPLFVLLLGGGQWLILRREAENAGWWPVVNAAALGAAGFLGLSIAKLAPPIAGTQYPSARALLIVGAVSGPVYAWLSWQFLAQLRRRPSAREGA